MIEPVLRGPGLQVRPFLRAAEVSPRSCSLPLQRAMTDFGADHGFGRVPKKLQEHYGITIAVSTVRKITERHGAQRREQQNRVSLPVSTPGCRQQIGELDGSMVPIVTSGTEAGDNRKHKKPSGTVVRPGPVSPCWIAASQEFIALRCLRNG